MEWRKFRKRTIRCSLSPFYWKYSQQGLQENVLGQISESFYSILILPDFFAVLDMVADISFSLFSFWDCLPGFPN